MQYHKHNDTFHIFDEVIVDGQRTLNSLDELHERNLLDPRYFYSIRGDASGRSRDTRSIKSDYDIIDSFFSNYSNKGSRIRYKLEVPRSNPPIRERHNIVNGYCKNSKGEIKLFVYDKCVTVDEGLRLTRLKSSGSLQERDDDRFQHCTTAIGYAIMWEYYNKNTSQNSFQQGVY